MVAVIIVNRVTRLSFLQCGGQPSGQRFANGGAVFGCRFGQPPSCHQRLYFGLAYLYLDHAATPARPAAPGCPPGALWRFLPVWRRRWYAGCVSVLRRAPGRRSGHHRAHRVAATSSTSSPARRCKSGSSSSAYRLKKYKPKIASSASSVNGTGYPRSTASIFWILLTTLIYSAFYRHVYLLLDRIPGGRDGSAGAETSKSSSQIAARRQFCCPVRSKFLVSDGAPRTCRGRPARAPQAQRAPVASGPKLRRPSSKV